MKYFFAFILLAITLHATNITIATYNVLNLFDGEYVGSEYGDFSQKRWGQKEYEKKLLKIVKVLEDMDADIIGLQEIENAYVLDELKSALGYRYSAVMEKKDSAITVGLLSNLPILDVQTLDVKNQRRGILRVIVSIDKGELVLYINHWKSLNSPEKDRLAYAKRLMDDISSLDREYIIMGDLNSEYNRYLYLKEKTAINHTLKTLQNSTLVKKDSLKKGLHYNLWLESPYESRFSYLYRGRKGTLDAFVIPYSMFDGKGIDYVDRSFEVFRPSYLYSEGKIDSSFSDHLPLKAEFSTTPYKSSETKPPKKCSISELNNAKNIEEAVLLEDIAVVHSDKYGFVIKDSSGAIYVFAPNANLELGRVYDLEALEFGRYHGAMQIRAFDVISFRSKVEQEELMIEVDSQNLNTKTYLNEVVSSIKGVYKKKRLYYKGGSIELYFRDKSKKPKQGDSIEIKNARVSLYKGSFQLIISENTEVKSIF